MALLQRHFLLITSATGLAWAIRTMPQLLPGRPAAWAGRESGRVGRGVRRLSDAGEADSANRPRLVMCLAARRPVSALPLVYVITLLDIDWRCVSQGCSDDRLGFSLPLAADRGASFTEASKVAGAWCCCGSSGCAGSSWAWLFLGGVSAYSTVLMIAQVQEVLGAGVLELRVRL
jgi:hypothetical protein